MTASSGRDVQARDYRKSLRQVGAVLLALGLFSIAWTIYRFRIPGGWQISYDPGWFLVIPGLGLLLGRLGMARFMAFVSACVVAATVGGGIGLLTVAPVGLVWAVLRGRDPRMLVGVLLAVAGVAALAWTYGRLSDPGLPRTWEEEPRVRRPRRPWLALAVGIVLAVPMVVGMHVMNRLPEARRAVVEAKRLTADRFDGFYLTGCAWATIPPGDVSAELIAYNAREVKRVVVAWNRKAPANAPVRGRVESPDSVSLASPMP